MIDLKQEKARSCGHRTAGGFYMVCYPSSIIVCPGLPKKVTPCPCCKHKIKNSRQVGMIRAAEMEHFLQCSGDVGVECPGEYADCPLSERHWVSGFLVAFIGQRFYWDWPAFRTEAEEMGIARRLSGRPSWWVSRGNSRWCLIVYRGEVHAVARVDEVQYLITEEDTPEKLVWLESKGVTPVEVRRLDSAFSRQCVLEF